LRTHALTALVTGNLLAGALGYACAGPALEHGGLGPIFLVVAGVASASAVVLVRVARRGGATSRLAADGPVA
jgi:hypothetical protein